MMTATKKTQMIQQATAAIVAAGHKNYAGRFYDPSKRGAYVTLESGFCNADFDDYVLIGKVVGASGRFCAEITAILESNRKSI